MAAPIKKKVKVLKAQYIERDGEGNNIDSIIILAECDEGQIRHQIHSTCFTFGGRDKATEMTKTAELMVGKTINLVFDPDKDMTHAK